MTYQLNFDCARRREALDSIRERRWTMSPEQYETELKAIRERFAKLKDLLGRYALDSAGIPTENHPDRFDPDRLPNRRNLDAVLSKWEAEDSRLWLYITGPSGTAKSWAASTIFAREVEGIDFDMWQSGEDTYDLEPDALWFAASDLKDQLGEIRSSKDKSEFIAKVAGAEVLVIDDVFHALSGPFLESLRRIIAERGEYASTVITSNYRPRDVLQAAQGQPYAKTAEAVCRRLAERCDFSDTTADTEVDW